MVLLQNAKNKRWLETRGGRGISDVLIDENGKLYVIMTDQNCAEIPVFLPYDEPVYNYIGQPGEDEWITDEEGKVVHPLSTPPVDNHEEKYSRVRP